MKNQDQNNGTLTQGVRVRLTHDFKNGFNEVIVEAGCLGEVVKGKERGTDVYPVRFEGLAVPLYTRRAHLELVQ